jgi:hypothetical protein
MPASLSGEDRGQRGDLPPRWLKLLCDCGVTEVFASHFQSLSRFEGFARLQRLRLSRGTFF